MPFGQNRVTVGAAKETVSGTGTGKRMQKQPTSSEKMREKAGNCSAVNAQTPEPGICSSVKAEMAVDRLQDLSFS